MTTVRYTETYDLSTKVDKMGLIAVHTPTLGQLNRLYPGLITNHRFIRVDSCDIVCACASVMPADPLQVGTEAGEIAPQDMFNPILYKAVSNDSFNTVVNRMYGLGVTSDSLGAVQDAFSGNTDVDQFNLYYGLLGSQDGWRKAMPQQGFEMTGLYPIVYHLLNSFGNAPPTTSGLASVPYPDNSGTAMTSGSLARTFRGNACRMPRMMLHTRLPDARGMSGIRVTDPTTGTQYGQSVLDGGVDIPITYVACIVTPPAKLHKLYYRMRVTWTFTFEEVIPVTEYARIDEIASRGQALYATDYAEQSKMMDNVESTVDTKDVDLEKIMTAGK